MNKFYLSLALTCLATTSMFAQFSATIIVADAGTLMPLENATVDLNGNIQTTDAMGQVVYNGLVDGTYQYTVSATCYTSSAGNITINGADAMSAFALEPLNMNNVFWYIGEPFALTGATVHVIGDGGYDASFVTWDTWGGEMLGDVPFGDYSYTITAPCYETTIGNFTVVCNNGEGIVVIEDPAELVIDPTVNLVGTVLTAVTPGAVYQWVDCDNNNAPINGATGQSFEPTENGNYAVIITINECPVTSACTAVVVTAVQDHQGNDAFHIYPNPFNEAFTVSTGAKTGTVHVELFNADGRAVLNETRTGTELISVQTAQLPSGTYMLRVITDNTSHTNYVVK